MVGGIAMKGFVKSVTNWSRPAKADPSLHWFGKLPAYGDYLSSGSAGWAGEFSQWITDGCARAQGGYLSGGGIVRLPSSEMTVLFVIRGYGGDKASRDFPFCMFVGLPTVDWPQLTSPTIGRVLGIHRQLASRFEAIDQFIAEEEALRQPDGVGERLGKVLGGEQVDFEQLAKRGPEPWEAAAAGLSMETWFGEVGAAFEGRSAAEWMSSLGAWGGKIAELDVAELTLRLPLSGQQELDLQVAGWLRWLECRAAASDQPETLLWNYGQSVASAALTLVRRRLIAEDFVLLTSRYGAIPYVDDASCLPVASSNGSLPRTWLGLASGLDPSKPS